MPHLSSGDKISSDEVIAMQISAVFCNFIPVDWLVFGEENDSLTTLSRTDFGSRSEIGKL